MHDDPCRISHPPVGTQLLSERSDLQLQGLVMLQHCWLAVYHPLVWRLLLTLRGLQPRCLAGTDF